jgi:acetylglutamate kinase
MIKKLHDPILRSKLISEGNFTSKAIKNLTNLSGETFIICLAGQTLNKPELLTDFSQDVVALRQAGVNIIIVHEGGIFLEQILTKLGIKKDTINNVALADKDNIEIFEMVLSGHVNKKIVSHINKSGGMAIGLSGKDGNLLEGKKIRKVKLNEDYQIDQILTFTSIGEASMIIPEILLSLEETEIIPVISPVALSAEGETLYLDAINVGAIIASSLIASKYIIYSDETLQIEDKVVAEIHYEQLQKLSEDKTNSINLRNIFKHSLTALEHHTDSIHIIDSSVNHSLLLELLSDEGIGTKIYAFDN